MTHRLLAQWVRIMEQLPSGEYRVEFEDGSIGTADADEVVPVKAMTWAKEQFAEICVVCHVRHTNCGPGCPHADCPHKFSKIERELESK